MMGQSPTPQYAMLSQEVQDEIVRLYVEEEKNEKELGTQFGLAPRSVGKLLVKRGVEKHDRSTTASKKMKSKLDEPATVEEIRQLRKTCSLEEIAIGLNSSTSAVDRICKRYGILPPDNFAELQAERMKKAWTEEKRERAAAESNARVTPELRKRLSDLSRKQDK